MDGDFGAVLRSRQVLDLLGDGGCSDGEHLEAYLERRVLTYLSDGAEEQSSRYRRSRM